jgi:hypothetical protein
LQGGRCQHVARTDESMAYRRSGQIQSFRCAGDASFLVQRIDQVQKIEILVVHRGLSYECNA